MRASLRYFHRFLLTSPKLEPFYNFSCSGRGGIINRTRDYETNTIKICGSIVFNDNVHNREPSNYVECKLRNDSRIELYFVVYERLIDRFSTEENEYENGYLRSEPHSRVDW